MSGGEGGIRTLDTAQHRILTFQASPFNHSGTSPRGGIIPVGLHGVNLQSHDLRNICALSCIGARRFPLHSGFRSGNLWYYTYLIDQEFVMSTVTVSPKFQVVIPKDVREALEIKAGQKIQVMAYRNRIELIPLRPIKELRGFLKGIDTDVERERDRV